MLVSSHEDEADVIFCSEDAIAATEKSNWYLNELLSLKVQTYLSIGLYISSCSIHVHSVVFL